MTSSWKKERLQSLEMECSSTVSNHVPSVRNPDTSSTKADQLTNSCQTANPNLTIRVCPSELRRSPRHGRTRLPSTNRDFVQAGIEDGLRQLNLPTYLGLSLSRGTYLLPVTSCTASGMQERWAIVLRLATSCEVLQEYFGTTNNLIETGTACEPARATDMLF